MKNRKIILLVLVGLIFLFAFNFLLFTGTLQGLPASVNNALESDGAITVTASLNKLVIHPATDVNVGLIMYGEGSEDVRMYAPIARMIAEGGVRIVVLGTRLQPNSTDEEQFRRIDSVLEEEPGMIWYIGGHTYGAQIPVKYAVSHSRNFQGIVLWAARLSSDSDLSSISLPVLYIYGNLDDANVDLLTRNKSLVPGHTQWVMIDGANRADFSYWGPMAADVGSTIPIPEIQRQAAEATKAFMLP